MATQLLPVFVAALLLSAASMLALALYWWPHRRAVPAAFFVLVLGSFVWSFFYAIDLLSAGLAAKVFWFKLAYLGVVTTPPAWLMLAAQFTDQAGWISRRNVLLLFILPAFTWVLLLTNETHGLVWSEVQQTSLDFRTSHGPWFWVWMSYGYLVVLAGGLLLLRAAVKAHHLYRRQILLLGLANLLPWLADIVYLLGLFPIPELDLTPFGFTIGAVVMSLGVLRYRLFDVIPVARSVLVESMSDAILVLDTSDRVVDLNLAAAGLTGSSADGVIGRPAGEVLAGWPALRAHLGTTARLHHELESGGEPVRFYDLEILPLTDGAGRLSGRLVVLRDVSERRRAARALEAANARLADQLAEIQVLQVRLREEAIRDALTGLFNRRYLEETLPRELRRAERDGHPLSVVLIDIDHFKRLNDTHGHPAGDRVLQALAGRLTSLIRGGDVVCRFGGEEFLLAMPRVARDVAAQRAERWRNACEALTTVFEGAELRATISLGVATFPDHGVDAEALIAAADKALYRAKAAGRNRVVVCD